MPDTYEMSEGGVLTCFECEKRTTNGLDVELRHCSGCGFWHVPRLKPSWAKNDLELDVVEAAMELAEAREAMQYGPAQIMLRQATERLDAATEKLSAENEGKWKRT